MKRLIPMGSLINDTLSGMVNVFQDGPRLPRKMRSLRRDRWRGLLLLLGDTSRVYDIRSGVKEMRNESVSLFIWDRNRKIVVYAKNVALIRFFLVAVCNLTTIFDDILACGLEG